jgi:hypothetical protein
MRPNGLYVNQRRNGGMEYSFRSTEKQKEKRKMSAQTTTKKAFTKTGRF